jgi:hypothetical protein
MKRYYNAVNKRNWKKASECFSQEFYDAYKPVIEDREFFDCYSGKPNIGEPKTEVEIFPIRYVTVRSVDKEKAKLYISQMHPWIPSSLYVHYGLQCSLVEVILKEYEGKWKIALRDWETTGPSPMERFENHYKECVSPQAYGWAARNENFDE